MASLGPVDNGRWSLWPALSPAERPIRILSRRKLVGVAVP